VVVLVRKNVCYINGLGGGWRYLSLKKSYQLFTYGGGSEKSPSTAPLTRVSYH